MLRHVSRAAQVEHSVSALLRDRLRPRVDLGFTASVDGAKSSQEHPSGALSRARPLMSSALDAMCWARIGASVTNILPAASDAAPRECAHYPDLPAVSLVDAEGRRLGQPPVISTSGIS